MLKPLRLGLICFVITAVAASGYGFGKSVIKNERMKWRVLETEHFNIYFYEEEAFLADYAAEEAELTYARVSDDLGVELSRRIPIIIYMSARHFEQNTIMPIQGEGIGGFAEPLRRRVILPFNGSQRQFEDTLTHEITHQMTFEELYPTAGSLFGALAPPDWFMEGLPEHVADDWNPEGEMVLRDAVMYDYLPTLEEMDDFYYLPSVYLGYKCGHSLCDYIAETYGEEALADLLRTFARSKLRKTDDALDDVLGVKGDELTEDWHVYLKRQFWPQIEEKHQTKEFAELISPRDDRADKIAYFKPKCSPSGDMLACLTVKDRFIDIFLMNAETGEKFENITKGYTLSEYDYLMYLENGLSWSPDGNFVTFVAKKDTFDQLYILNVLNGKVATRFNPKFEDVVAPAYSPDGRYIAFAAQELDRKDIYLYETATGTVRRVTDDPYADGYPTWSPDGEYIYYASERESFNNVFRVRPDGSDMEQLTFGGSDNTAPDVSPDGSTLLFTSNRYDGIYNIFAMDLETRGVGRYTDVIGSVMDASWSPDGGKIAFTAYEDQTYSVYTMDAPDASLDSPAVERPAEGDYVYETAVGKVYSEPIETADVLSEGPITFEGDDYFYELSSEGVEVLGPAPKDEPTDEPGWDESYVETARELAAEDVLERSRKYGLNWGADYVYTTFEFTTGGEFRNYSVVGISDILGAHRMDIMFDLVSVSSYEDLNGALYYYYLTRRPTYVFGGSSWRYYGYASERSYYERQSGAFGSVYYPFTYRTRAELTLFGYYQQRRYSRYVDRPDIPDSNNNLLGAEVGLVRDTCQWYYFYPTAGSRMRYSLEQTIAVSASSLRYTRHTADVRRYIRISDRNNLAFRVVAGYNHGRDPQPYFLGGGLSLRGYKYNALYGTKMFLANFEYRFPLIDFIVTPIPGLIIGGFRGVFFTDFGTAWSDWDEASAYPEDHQWYVTKEDTRYKNFKLWSTDGGFHLVHAKMSFGLGLRWWFGYFDMMFDWAWRTDLREVDGPAEFHFTLGYPY
ncbi:MAG: PD40 domain-containing protein [Candidatus Coatesbacteria bacterium]|nr:MAG: PD40 domain-containing protein [Candidatus Coatesbacteria bacterium]